MEGTGKTLSLRKDQDRPINHGFHEVEAEEVESRVVDKPKATPQAAFVASAQGTLGNDVVQSALSGRGGGVAGVLGDAMALGAAGVHVAGDVTSLLANSFLNELMAGGADGAGMGEASAEGMPAPSESVARRAEGEVLPEANDPRLGILGQGGGSPLPTALRSKMETAFGHDFRNVRIHVGGAEARAAEALNAHAFAVGDHIFFGGGEFSPDTHEGQHLLAHELQHIVQKDEGRLPTRSAGGDGMDVSSPSDPHEVEAERVAGELVSGGLGTTEAASAEAGHAESGIESSAPAAEGAVSRLSFGAPRPGQVPGGFPMGPDGGLPRPLKRALTEAGVDLVKAGIAAATETGPHDEVRGRDAKETRGGAGPDVAESARDLARAVLERRGGPGGPAPRGGREHTKGGPADEMEALAQQFAQEVAAGLAGQAVTAVLGEGAHDGLMPGGKAAGELAKRAAGSLGEAVGAVNGAVGEVTGAVGEVNGAVNGVVGQVNGALGQATGALNGALGQATNAVNGAAETAQEVVGGAIAPVTEGVKAAQGALTGAAGAAQGAVGDVANQVTGAVNGVAGQVTGAVNGAVGQATGAVNGAIGQALGGAGPLGGALAGAAQGAVGDVANKVNGAVNGAVGQVTGAVNGAVGQAAGAVNGALAQVVGVAGGAGAAGGAGGPGGPALDAKKAGPGGDTKTGGKGGPGGPDGDGKEGKPDGKSAKGGPGGGKPGPGGVGGPVPGAKPADSKGVKDVVGDAVAALAGDLGEEGAQLLGNAVGNALAPVLGQAINVRDVPRMAWGALKTEPKQDKQLQKQTGLDAAGHRQKIDDHVGRIHDQVEFLRKEIESFAADKVKEFEEAMAARAAEAMGQVGAATTQITTAYGTARTNVAGAATTAHGKVDGDAASARSALDTSLPANQTKLQSTYDTAKAKVGEMRKGWQGPFDKMVDDAAKEFQKTAEGQAKVLAGQKETIAQTWKTGSGNPLQDAENEARQKAARKGVDDAVKSFTDGATAKADAVRAEKPQYQGIVDKFLTPIEAKVEATKTDGAAKIQAAYDGSVKKIDTDKAGAHQAIDASAGSANTSLNAGETSAKGEVASAGTKLQGDVQAAVASSKDQVNSTARSLEDRYTEWMNGVLQGIPADQPMVYDTAKDFLAAKEQELPGFHQGLLLELDKAVQSAREGLEKTLAGAIENVRQLGGKSAAEAAKIGEQQVAGINQQAERFGQSMVQVGGAVDVAFQTYVAPLSTQMEAYAKSLDAEIKAMLDASKGRATEANAAYLAQLQERIGQMPKTLTPMVNAAAAKVRPNLEQRAKGIHKAVKGLGTDENLLFNSLRGLTGLTSAALQQDVWPQLFGSEGGMVAFIDDDLDDGDKATAHAYLSGNNALGAKLELESCIHWYGDDEEQIEKILRDLPQEDRDKMQNLPGWDKTREKLVSNLDGTDLDVTKALLAGNDKRADAYRLKESIDKARASGDPDALAKALEGVPQEDLKAVQQEFYNVQHGVNAEQKNVPPVDSTQAANDLAQYATAEIKTGDPYQDQYLNEKFGGANKDLISALAKDGKESETAAVARFEVERTRGGGPDMENMEKALYAPPDLQERLHSPNPEERTKAQAEQKEREAKIRGMYQEQYGKKNGLTMDTAVDGMFKGNDKEADVNRRVLKNMLVDGTNTPRVAADQIWLEGKNKVGTDEAGIKRSLSGMRPDEVKELAAVYGEQHGNGRSDTAALYKDLGVVERNPDGSRKQGGDHSGFGSELSGDDRREVEELLMGDDKYMSPQEKLAKARLQKDWTVGQENDGFFGSIGRGGMSDTNERKDFDRNFAALEEAAKKMGPDGKFLDKDGKEDPEARKEYEKYCRSVGINAEEYRAAQDRIANYATTAVAVVGAAVVTVATAGAGAPVAVAMVGAAVTGGASMAINASMKGGRYGWEDATKDAAITAVSVATAGVGTKLQTMNGGAGILNATTALDKTIQAGTIGLGTGFVNGAANTALTDGTWDKGIGQGLLTTGGGGVKQALVEGVSGAVTTGMDESKIGKAMFDRNAYTAALAKGTAAGTGMTAGTASGIGFDAARGKYKGDFGDAMKDSLIEGAKQTFGAGAGGAYARTKFGPATAHGNHQEQQSGAHNDAEAKTQVNNGTPEAQPQVHPENQTQVHPETQVAPVDTTTTTPDKKGGGGQGHVEETVVAPHEKTTPQNTEQTQIKDPVTGTNTTQHEQNNAQGGVGDKNQKTGGSDQAVVSADKDAVSVSTKERTVVHDGDTLVVKNNDGSADIVTADGTQTHVTPEGHTMTMLEDGTVIAGKEGKNAVITPEGEVHPIGPDGKIINPTETSSATQQREQAVANKVEEALRTGQITEEQALTIRNAGDVSAQETALKALDKPGKLTDDQLMDKLVDLGKLQKPDKSGPMFTDEELLKVIDAPDPERALKLVEADARNQSRDAEVAQDVYAKTRVDKSGNTYVDGVFDHVTLGAGFAGISNEMSLPKGTGESLVIGGKNPWSKAKAKLGQPAGESEVVNSTAKMTETAQTAQERFMAAKEHAENVEINRADNNIGVFNGEVKEILPRTEADPAMLKDWPDGAKVRLSVKDEHGNTMYVYANQVDLAGGPGPSRQLRTHDHGAGQDAQISPELYAKLKSEGKIVSSDQGFDPKTIAPGEDVVVFGAGASGAWGSEGASHNAESVTWLGKQASPDHTKGLTPNQTERLGAIYERLNAAKSGTPEYAAAMKDLESFTFKEAPGNGYLPRNKEEGGAFSPDMQKANGGKVELKAVPDVQSITWEQNPTTGKQQMKITVKGTGEVIWCDKLVTAIGQDGKAGHGPGSLLKEVPVLKPIVDASGQHYEFPVVVGLETPDGSIRVLGAAATSPALTEKITQGPKGFTGKDAAKNFEMQANHGSTPQDSMGVIGSFQHAEKMIAAANKETLVELASLPGEKQGELIAKYRDEQIPAYDHSKNEKTATPAWQGEIPAPKEVLGMHSSEFAQNPMAQKTLFDAAGGAVERMKAAAAAVTEGLSGAEVVSLRKRDNLNDFVTEVMKKQTTKGYKEIGEMSDIIRGRFNLEAGEDMQIVVDRLKETFGADIVEIKPPRDGYPRWHINTRDAETGLVHEWQVGTKSTTDFFERRSLTIPETVTQFKGEPNFHDGVYKLLTKASPEVKAKYGVDALMPEYKALTEETGVVTHAQSQPQDYGRRYNEMAKRIDGILASIERDQPGYFDKVLSSGGGGH